VYPPPQVNRSSPYPASPGSAWPVMEAISAQETVRGLPSGPPLGGSSSCLRNYSKAKVFAAPGQVQVALGPAGNNIIETDAVPAGTVTLSLAFSGTFSSWFLDGQGFLSTLNNTVWGYSSTGAQQSIINFPSTFSTIVGQQNWVWMIGSYNTSTRI